MRLADAGHGSRYRRPATARGQGRYARTYDPYPNAERKRRAGFGGDGPLTRARSSALVLGFEGGSVGRLRIMNIDEGAPKALAWSAPNG